MNMRVPISGMSNASASNASDSSTVEATEDRPLALLRTLASEDGQSLPRLAKRLGLAASELQRLLVALGDDPQFGGLQLVEVRSDLRGRNCIWLTARGQSLCDGSLDDGMLREGMLDEGMLHEGMHERGAA
jgi:hypothetical protein